MLSRTKIVSGWFGHWIRPICLAVVVVAAIAMLAIWNNQTVSILAVDSASMEPFISEGDAVISRQVNPLDLRKGDIVSYRSPEDSSLIITHRVLLADPLTGQLITKGDANTSLDPTFNGSEVIGRVTYIVPGGGLLLNAVHSWPGLLSIFYLPAALLLMSELRRLAKYYLQPTYVLHRRY